MGQFHHQHSEGMRHSAKQRPYQQWCLLFVLAGCVFITSQAQNPTASPAPNATPPLQPTSSPAPAQPVPQSTALLNPLTLDEALRLADAQASAYQTAVLNEKIAAFLGWTAR